MTIQERLREIVRLGNTSIPLVDFQTQLQGPDAYVVICENLGIRGMISNEAYKNARPDLRERHLRMVFKEWTRDKHIKVRIVMNYVGSDHMLITEFDSSNSQIIFPGRRYELENVPVVTRIESLLLRFSTLWICTDG